MATGIVKIMTYNIRYDNDWDLNHSWNSRKEGICKNILKYQPDILGIQEGMKNQVDYLDENLKEYQYVGVARGDGKEKDEFAAIFYNVNRYELLSTNTFWLSDTPDRPSFGWDAACTRICTWAKLQDKITGNFLYHFNTHFDHEGKIAQKESAQLILKMIEEIAGSSPAIFTGDLNITPEMEPYKILTESEGKLIDSCAVVSEELKNTGTFTDFGKLDKYWKIDYVFIKNNIEVKEVIIDNDESNTQVSDHYPVIATLAI